MYHKYVTVKKEKNRDLEAVGDGWAHEPVCEVSGR